MLYVVLYNTRRMGLLLPSPCRMPWLEIGSHYYRQALIQVVFSPPETHARTLPYNRHWHHWKVCLAKSNHLFRVIYNIVKHRLHVWCGHRPGPAATPHWPVATILFTGSGAAVLHTAPAVLTLWHTIYCSIDQILMLQIYIQNPGKNWQNGKTMQEKKRVTKRHYSTLFNH